YHAAAPGQLQRAVLTMRVRGAAPAFAQPLREMAVAMDPNLVLRDIRTLDESLKREQWIIRLEAAVLLGVTISVLLLASGGIYALMSFTVAQRRREIGIRIALGAGRRNIVTSIFSRALIQLGCGAVLGSGIAFALSRFVIGEGREGVYALAGVVLAVVLVGLFAALGPTRRSLRIQPTEALREQ
ncbi:MAG: FtsX-like permease family protein, partial [Acidobacteria bacterium]|nr:FtsX-like permease family protein [Acidobacteriota bacterium]